MRWKQVRYGLNGLVVIPKTLQAYLIAITIVCLVGLFYIVGSLMPFEPFKFYGWTDLPDKPVCPGADVNGSFEAEVVGGPYRVGHIKGIAYWVDEEGNPLPGVVPIDSDLKVSPRHEYREVSDRIAPLSSGKARPAWDATINGWMFGIVPVSYVHDYVSEKSVTILPLDAKKCEGGM